MSVAKSNVLYLKKNLILNGNIGMEVINRDMEFNKTDLRCDWH